MYQKDEVRTHDSQAAKLSSWLQSAAPKDKQCCLTAHDSCRLILKLTITAAAVSTRDPELSTLSRGPTPCAYP
jgi:hypothetical protein